MKYKYICNKCNSNFNEPIQNKQIESSLIRSAILVCPYCRSVNIDLTNQAKLLIQRRAKINKIQNDKSGIN